MGTSPEIGHIHQKESLREELLAEIAAIASILIEQAPESENLGCPERRYLGASAREPPARFPHSSRIRWGRS